MLNHFTNRPFKRHNYNSIITSYLTTFLVLFNLFFNRIIDTIINIVTTVIIIEDNTILFFINPIIDELDLIDGEYILDIHSKEKGDE